MLMDTSGEDAVESTEEARTGGRGPNDGEGSGRASGGCALKVGDLTSARMGGNCCTPVATAAGGDMRGSGGVARGGVAAALPAGAGCGYVGGEAAARMSARTGAETWMDSSSSGTEKDSVYDGSNSATIMSAGFWPTTA
jgi:hypothetical protein